MFSIVANPDERSEYHVLGVGEMTIKDWRKAFKQLKAKPAILKKYMKHNAPKKRSTGMVTAKCENCGRYGAHIGKYGMHLCRHCFREMAVKIGFKKYT
jgi:ribosomal protein S14